MTTILRIISNKKTILSAFIFVQVFGLIWLVVSGKTSSHNYMSFDNFLLLKIATLLFYLLLVYLSLKNIKVVTWILAAILLYSGVGSSFIGIFRIEWYQYFLKAYFFIFGIYFIFGSVALIYNPTIVLRK